MNESVTGQETDASKPKAPNWAIQPFREAIARLENLDSLLQVTHAGVSMFKGMPNLVQVLAETTNVDTERQEYEQQLPRARDLAELAETEIEGDYPLLNSLATVYLWTVLDSFIRDYLALWISRRPTARRVEPLERIKINYATYEALRPRERSGYVIERMAEEMRLSRKHGMNRFRPMIKPFGLSFKLKKKVERDLIELQNVRNLVVHRNGLLDRRFKDACPWIRLGIGKPISISSSDVGRYTEASLAVLMNLLYEVGTIYGVDYEEEKKRFREQ